VALNERVRFLVVLTIAAVAARLFSLTWLTPLNWDEVEFFRATDWVRQGLVPFRDFWEHHTPMQWFVFAPFTALTTSTGAGAIIFMRWMQVPLWIAIFWLVNVWMRNDGAARFARWMAIVLAVCSSLFMLPAIEYRVDVLACGLYIGGLVLLQKQTSRASFWAGVLFCLTGFANIRLGPLLALTVLLNRVIDVRERRWRGTREANWVFAGVIAAFAVALAWFLATDSLKPLYQHVWVENYLGDRYAERVPLAFVHRMLIPFGVRIYGSGDHFDLIGVDPAGAAIVVLGIIGLVRALREWRAPGVHFYLAFLQVSSMLFISVMKFVYHYHLEIVVLMMLPFVASEISRGRRASRPQPAGVSPAGEGEDDTRRRDAGSMRAGRPPAWIAFAAAVCAWSIFLTVFRGKERDLAYQDLIMREAHTRTAPGAKVFDGVGWALRRQPAWRFWFLPELVRKLVQERHLPPYGVAEWLTDPPAAVITDRNAAVWLAAVDPQLGVYVVRHYLPVWRNLLMPGLSTLLAPGATAGWVVPADGRYRIVVAPELASHEWFRRPLAYRAGIHSGLQIVARGADRVQWHRNGSPATVTGNAIDLKRGDRLAVRSPHPVPVAVFLVPGEERLWFRQPPDGVTLDSEGPRVTHVPFSEPTPTSSARP
jgi:hypothetical protein